MTIEVPAIFAFAALFFTMVTVAVYFVIFFMAVYAVAFGILLVLRPLFE